MNKYRVILTVEIKYDGDVDPTDLDLEGLSLAEKDGTIDCHFSWSKPKVVAVDEE